jgi:MSHA biogenesis protein MshO
MAILAIVSGTVVGVILFGGQIFADVSGRDQMLSQSRFVLERMNRDLRNALPNSVRVQGNMTRHCLEYVPIRWSTFYFDIPTVGEPLSNTIAVVRLNTNNDAYLFTAGDQVIVNPLTNLQVYDDSQDERNRFGLLAVANNVAGDTDQNALTINLTGQQRFVTDSLARRIYIIGQPVSYCIESGQITRHTNYGFVTNQSTINNVIGAGVLMAENVANQLSADPTNVMNNADDPFRVIEAGLQRNAFVHIRLSFARPEDPAEVIAFNNEVQIPNVP